MYSQFNTETEEENIPYVFSDGFIIYGEKTDSKNYTEIEVPCLKHHKSDFILAVKTQLLYFKDITFNVIYGNYQSEIEFLSKPIYNSKNLIISNESPFSKPHVVIIKNGMNDDTSGVCYGNIDFKELELQDMNGNIGIKCPIRQVIVDENGEEVEINPGLDVVPSREAVRWTANTRDFLKKQFGKAKEEAEQLIDEELKEENFIKWLKTSNSVLYNYSTGRNDSVISRLAKIIDLKEIEPVYKVNGHNIKFKALEKVFKGFSVKSYKLIYSYKLQKQVTERKLITMWGDFNFDNLFLKTEKSDPRINSHLCSIGATVLSVNNLENLLNENKSSVEIKDYTDKLVSLLIESGIKIYEDVIVSENSDVILSEEETVIEKEPTPAELRKLNERIVCNTITEIYLNTINGKAFKNKKKEPKISELQNREKPLFYGFQEDESKIHFAGELLKPQLNTNGYFNDDFGLVLISKQVKQHFKKFNHIDDLFGVQEEVIINNEKFINIKMNEHIIKWNTARKIKPHLDSFKFLNWFKLIDENYFDDFITLEKYCENNYSQVSHQKSYGSNIFLDNFVDFIDKIEIIQNITDSDRDDKLDAINEIILNSSLPNNTCSGIVIDKDIIAILNKLLIYSSDLKLMLNQLNLSYQNRDYLKDEFINEIKDFIKYKKSK